MRRLHAKPAGVVANVEEAEPGVDLDALFLKIARRRKKFFSYLVKRYQRPFLRLAFRILRDHGEAEDAVQDAFLKIYLYASRFHGGLEQRFSPWAYKVVYNTTITHYYQLRRWRGYETIDPQSPPLVSVSRERWLEFVRKRDVELAAEWLVPQIPVSLREAFVLYYLKDLPYTEISRRTHLSIGAIKMKLFRARQYCQRLVEKEFSPE